MFVPTISLYSEDLRIAAGMHSATSILEVSRAFEKVIDTDRERILTRWSVVKMVYPLYLFPIAIFIMAVATLYHIFALKRMVALRTRQLTIANQQLLEMTLTDSLTKLYNRRHLIEQLALLNHLKRNLTVMVFDIDDFKSINDRYGHLAGDRAIVAIAEAAKSMTDDRMTLARIGGEEFALVTSSLSEREALNFANMLCKAVYDQPVILGGQAIHLSISLGCAYYPEFTHIVSLQDADELMYQGKSEGKNRAVFQVITDCQLQPALRQVN